MTEFDIRGKAVGSALVAGILLGISGLTGCGSSGPQGCADIETAMTPHWEAVAEYQRAADRGEDPPDGWVDRFQAAKASALRDLATIEDREIGEIANIAQALQIYLAAETDSEVGKDAGIYALLALRSECGITPPD